VGVVSAVLLFAVIVALSALFVSVEEGEIAEKTAGQAPSEMRKLRNDQLLLLSDYRWVDQANGIVRIPIDRAIDLMLAEEAKKERDR
jgi:hypothetical protein